MLALIVFRFWMLRDNKPAKSKPIYHKICDY